MGKYGKCMERQIEDIKKAPEATTLRAPQIKTRSTNAIQDASSSRVVSQQQGSLVGEEQTTAAYQHPYCRIQGMLNDARVMLWQAGKERSKRGRSDTLKTTANYIDRIVILLPYYPVPRGDGRKWYHIGSPRGEGTISLADVSIFLSQAVKAIRNGDDDSVVVGILDKASERLADLIETEMKMVGGISK